MCGGVGDDNRITLSRETLSVAARVIKAKDKKQDTVRDVRAQQTKHSPYKIIRPNSIPQEKFLATPADIAVYGGSNGGGKTFALLMEACRHLSNPQFGAVLFR